MVSAEQIVEAQDGETRVLHLEEAAVSVAKAKAGPEGRADWLEAVRRQHRANFELWHIEDEARAPGASDADLAGVKRRVDRDQPAAQRPGRGVGPRFAGMAGAEGAAQPGSGAELRDRRG